MTMFKRIVTSVLTFATLATTAVGGITASAAAGSVTTGSGYATLTNTSGTTRYGIVSLQVVNRNTGATVARTSNEGVLTNYSSVTATASGYSAVTYRFNGSGTLYNGTSPWTGAYWSGSSSY